MKFSFVLGALVALMVSQSATAQTRLVLNQERKEISEEFERWWETPLVWKFDELPTKGRVPESRKPYAGGIYPDRAGGTYVAMRKYDRAFYPQRRRAAWFEQRDIAMHTTSHFRRGWFGGGHSVSYIPEWSGHCNGWASAAIRHAEPRKSVTRKGVTFTPADIKGMLAELYMYTNSKLLGGGYETVINPASFHVSLTNWVGDQEHPIAMERTPGSTVWNYPVYAFASTFKKRGRQVEVKVNIAFKEYLEREQNVAPQKAKNLYFHYALQLDKEGKIVGGVYCYDSNQIDFLWIPLPATQGGTKGNQQGNPYLDLDEVLAIWRESVSDEAVEGWVNIDSGEPLARDVAKAIAKAGE
jgi:hypothetical protein